MSDKREIEMEVRLHSTIDGDIWAKEFGKVICERPDLRLDHGFLTGWFANAIETGKQFGERSQEDKIRQAVKDEHDRAICAIGYVSSELASRSGAWDGDAPKWFPQPPEWLDLWEEGYLHGVIEDGDDD